MDKREIRQMMQLLQIEDVTTPRQSRNGTIVWKLPIKDADSKLYFEVASFKSGYVRNQGVSCHSNYQLNKRCESEPEYYELSNGDYRKYTSKERVLIPIEIDRLEYLISYCLKNYYIKGANQVADGKYVPKWKLENSISAHEYKLEQERDGRCEEVADFQRESDAKITELKNTLFRIKTLADYEKPF